jgi:hypothetical protein
VALPVQAGGLLVEALDTVHAGVLLAVLGSWVWTIVSVTKGPPSSGQQVWTGRRSRIYLVALVDDLLARGLGYGARRELRDFVEAREELKFRHQAFARPLGQSEKLLYAAPDLVKVLDT